MEANLLFFTFLIAEALLCALVFFTLFRKKIQIEHLTFSLVAFTIALWLPIAYYENDPSFAHFANLIVRLDFGVGAFILGSIYAFSLSFPVVKKQASKVILATFGVSLVLALVTITTDLFFHTITFDNGVHFSFGDLFIVFVAYYLWTSGSALVQWWRSYRSSSGVKRLQIKYIFLGFLLTLSIIFVFAFLLQNFIDPQYFRISVLAVIFIPLFSGYAILRYRLMDIRIVIQRGLIYSILVVLLGALYIGGLLVTQGLNYFSRQPGVAWVGLLTVIIGVFGFNVLERTFRKWTNPLFFKHPIQYGEALKKCNEILSVEVQSDSIVSKILERVRTEFHVRQASLVYCTKIREEMCAFHQSTDHGERREYLSIDDALLTYFRQGAEDSRVLVLEDFYRGFIPADIGDTAEIIRQEMVRLEAAICFSIVKKDGLVGVMCIGEKINGDPFFTPDLRWFDIIAKQIGIALGRATVYEHLQELVDQKTKALKEANTTLKRINDAKSEFVSIASHQLRTPLTVVKSIFSILAGGDLGRITAQQREFILRGMAQSDKLITLISELLQISRIEAGRMTLALTAVDLSVLVAEKLRLIEPLAKSKGLSVSFTPPSKPVVTNADAGLIGEVLINLLDNAVKYTDSGEITVTVAHDASMATVHVTDTGIGLSEHEKKQLFNRFVMGDHDRRLLRTGTGLGLYFCRRVVEAHGGTIWAESEGPGTGSIFSFGLPLS